MKALGIDIGTTSLCVAGYEEEKEELSFALSAQNRFLPGGFRQDPKEIREKIGTLLEKAKTWGFGPEELDAVGISSQMHGILYVDGNGQAVSPLYTWKEEPAGKAAQTSQLIQKRLNRLLRVPVYPGYGTLTHAVLKENGEIPGKAVAFCGIGDYIAMGLTGRKTPLTDASMAASFGGFDLERGAFDFQALDKARINAGYFPDLRKPGEYAGRWGRAKVSCAFGDNQASFLGAVRDPLRQIGLNVGTGSQVSVFDEALFPFSAGETRPFFGRGYLYVGASLNGGKAYERLADFLTETVRECCGADIDGYEALARLGQKREETSLRVRPLLYGERGKPQTGGSLEGLREENFHPADLVCAYVRGMAEELYQLYRQFPEPARKGRELLVASGNGLRKNPLLVREARRCFGLPLAFSAVREEAAAGAARAALLGY